ncbi:right-handed parallel beta-helix repeat-containing protein [Candidatus Poribacteria bacterium]
MYYVTSAIFWLLPLMALLSLNIGTVYAMDVSEQYGLSSVKDFGAVADGVTDDSEAIQKAMDEGAGVIWFPRGDYKITGSIIVNLTARGKTVIKGAGSGARLINYGDGPALRLIGSHAGTALPDTVSDTVWAKESMPLVSELEIVGSNENADGIQLERTFQVIISRVLVRNCRHGIHAVKRNRNLIVANCHIYNNSGVGIYLDNLSLHQTNITGSHISYNGGGGVKVVGGDVFNLQITGNDIEYNHAGADSEANDVWIVAGEGVIQEGAISGNTIQSTPCRNGANIRIEGPVSAEKKPALLSIVGNLITNQTYNIVIRNSRGIIVTGNTFTKGIQQHIKVENSAQISIGPNVFDDIPEMGGDAISGISLDECIACSITGVILQNPHGGSSGNGGSIQVTRSSGINVDGCTILDPKYRGIYFHDVVDSRISNCIILEKRAEKTMRESISESGKSGHNMIVNNQASKGIDSDIRSEGRGTIVSNNLLGCYAD